jgi:hypothetical protein
MRAIDCPCGHRLEGQDDEELFLLARLCLPSEVFAWWERRAEPKGALVA